MKTLALNKFQVATYNWVDLNGYFVEAYNKEYPLVRYFWHSSPMDDPEGRIFWTKDVRKAEKIDRGDFAGSLSAAFTNCTFIHVEFED